jgi:DNA-directed RNA polymerase specialized sigma subunit
LQGVPGADGQGRPLTALLNHAGTESEKLHELLFLTQALQNLTETEKRVTHLRFFRSGSLEQISTTVKMSQEQVTAALEQILQDLTRKLQDKKNNEPPINEEAHLA